MSAKPRGKPRVVLHVGTPKSGTTFVQRALWFHRDALRSAGVLIPGSRGDTAFRGAIEVRESARFWGFDSSELAGTWRRLCQEALRYGGTTVISHEILASASEPQIDAALAELEGAEVHIALTTRDLARQVTSEWQERIKNGETVRWPRFEARIWRQLEARDESGGFLLPQYPPGILGRWGRAIPAERIHVVVGPPPGAGSTVLWSRFAEAVGFDGSAFDPLVANTGSNKSLGSAQIEVLRQVNRALGGRLQNPHYSTTVKRVFAQRLLAAQDSPRPECPAELAGALRELALEANAEISRRGYTVHGALEELIPAVPAAGAPAPGVTRRRDVERAYAEVIATMLINRAKLQRPPAGRGSRMRNLAGRARAWVARLGR